MESGKNYSATEANPSIPDMSAETQTRHAKHLRPGKSYPKMTMEEYVQKSGELARSKVGGDILGYRASNGSIIRYNKASNDWVRAYDTGVSTMFKPLRGMDYYNDKMQEHGGVSHD